MLILIEGVDRTGKSTLARSLAGATGAVLHFSKPTVHPLNEYARPIEAYRPGKGERLILDRGHVGESVWPLLFRRESLLDESSRRWLELFYLSRGAAIVWATRELSSLERACEEDGEPIWGDDVRTADAAFREVLKHGACPTFEYDQERKPIPFKALDALDAWERYCARIFKVHHRWIGSPMPQLLLVGEQVGPAARRVDDLDPSESRTWDLPFVPYRGTSGHFLLEDLPNGLWQQIAITNALQPNGEPEDLPSLVGALGYPKVVTLGKEASAVAAQQGVKHGEAPHPQFVRRFKRSEGPGYLTRLILEAAGGSPA